MNNNVRILLGYLKNHKFNLVIVFCSLFTVALSLLGVGTVFRHLVDNGLSTNELNSINNAIFLTSGLIATFAIGSFFRSYFINIVAEKITSQIRADSYADLLELEIATFEELKIGDIISRLGSDLESVGTLITNFLSFFIRNSIMLSGAIILMFLQSAKLSMLVIFTVPVLLTPLLHLSKHIRSMSRKVMAEKSNLSSFIEESFSAIRTLYAFNQQTHSLNRFNEKITTYVKHSSKRLKLRSLFFALAIAAIAGSITMVIWIGSIDIIDGKMTSGQMISFIYYAMIVGMSAGGIAELFSEIQGPFAALERVFNLRTNPKTYPNSQAIAKYPKKSENALQNYDITFENVNFSYPSRKDILALDNISFRIRQNRSTAIVGKSGSGKSTIMQLLLNFYSYQTGKIKVAGQDVNSYDRNYIRKIMAYTPQEPDIFSGTIRYNIMFSNPDAKEEDFQQVVHLCGIDKFTNNLPAGLDTEIGEKGVRISGGQKQRIAIARALLYQPEILLLDEATSALDNESEQEILDNIKKIMDGKTIISIAHRITSIQDFDNILVIDQGKLVSSGTHKELIGSCEIYNILYKKSLAN
ncbi:MAG: ATP-binding cassette domain-containing protein [Rickettsiales bacterium]|nr:ATP-binding cassette domain-containing protein [Rickettsiales bacterium]